MPLFPSERQPLLGSRREALQDVRTILSYARPHGRLLGWLSASAATAALIGALQPWPIKLLVDNVLGGKALPGGLELLMRASGVDRSRYGLLAAVAVIGVLLPIVQGSVNALATLGWTSVGRSMTYDLSQDLFGRLQRRSLGYHLAAEIGELIGRVGEDAWSVYKLFDTLVFKPIYSGLLIFFTLAVMMSLEPVLACVVLVVAPAMLVTSTFVGRKLSAAAEDQRELEGALRSHVQQTLAGLPVVQSFAQEGRQQMRFVDLAARLLRAQQRAGLLGSLGGLSPGMASMLGYAAVLWAGGYQVLSGTLTLGSMLLFLAYYGSFQKEIGALVAVYPAVQALLPSIRRVSELLASEPEVSERAQAAALGPVRGAVSFEGVSFGYQAGRPTLCNVSLAVEPGETIALVGPTGAGKSTLVSLIPRFFDPREGRVLIDGQDLRTVQLASLRRHVALVLQEPFLFPLTIAENIAYGRPDATNTEIENVARAANAHEFICDLPDGYATVIGERGATLSGGERQRLSIARALLKDAPILILDEPTSALDAGSEALVMDALAKLTAGRTTFIIAHRLATVRQADRIVVLEQGRIVQTGTHAQLVSNGGLYADYSALQSATPEKDGQC